MKKIFLILSAAFFVFLAACNSGSKTLNAGTKETGDNISELSNDSFKKLIFNYEKSDSFKFEGTRPVIIDFYADWCAPCRQLSPIVESIAKEYEGKINVYKVDTEKERLLAQNLGITALPTLLFIPSEGMPRSSMGLISKEDMIKAINDILLIK